MKHGIAPGTSSGTIVAAYGRQYLVEFASGKTLLCFPRGKKSDFACGDEVRVREDGKSGDGDTVGNSIRRGVIESVAPRRSLFYRSNEFRQKLIAANVTQIAVVVATEPSFSEELLNRCLVAAAEQDIAALIVLNKCDLGERVAAARSALAPYVALGYPVIETCALGAESGLSNETKISGAAASASLAASLTALLAELRAHLSGQVSVLVGQSGMGKSTLINALIPDAGAATREISSALDSGKHTTTHARLYRLDAASALIDSPGLQTFGLAHLDLAALEGAFPEFRPYLGQCRFRDCRHDREPGCALTAALAEGKIGARRFAVYRQLREEHAGKGAR